MVFLPLKKFLPEQIQNHENICGIDEVGRGCWAGPLVACALVLKKKIVFRKLKDSKKLSREKREAVFKILQKCSRYGVGVVQVEEIDQLGLIKANNLAFNRALENLQRRHNVTPAYLVIDGRDKLKLAYQFRTIIKGDEKIKLIACASIVAKVTRDQMMRALALKYPHYGFEDHKGYGTERHNQAIHKLGICKIHRKSYKPIREFQDVASVNSGA